MAERYVFATAAEAAEAERLQLIEQDFDLFSQSRLMALGLDAGHHCLEIGVGTGSMARWLASITGPAGRVVGVDIDDRFFALSENHGVELVHGDIRTVDFDEASFDFVHARLLVEHLADREAVVARVLRWLKPGGWIVLADCDYSIPYRTAGELGALWNRAQDAVADAVVPRGADFRFGMSLPALMTGVGISGVRAHVAYPLILDPASNGRLLQLAFALQRQFIAFDDVPTAGSMSSRRRCRPGTLSRRGSRSSSRGANARRRSPARAATRARVRCPCWGCAVGVVNASDGP